MLCECSMGHGHKLAKLKPANNQNFVFIKYFSHLFSDPKTICII